MLTWGLVLMDVVFVAERILCRELYGVSVLCNNIFIALCFLLLLGDDVMVRCCLCGFWCCWVFLKLMIDAFAEGFTA